MAFNQDWIFFTGLAKQAKPKQQEPFGTHFSFPFVKTLYGWMFSNPAQTLYDLKTLKTIYNILKHCAKMQMFSTLNGNPEFLD